MAASLACLTGCAGTIKELANDSAIVGFTGFVFSVGLETTPLTGGIPIPSVRLGYGTAWRIGKHDNVNVMVGGESVAGGTKTELVIGASNNP